MINVEDLNCGDYMVSDCDDTPYVIVSICHAKLPPRDARVVIRELPTGITSTYYGTRFFAHKASPIEQLALGSLEQQEWGHGVVTKGK